MATKERSLDSKVDEVLQRLDRAGQRVDHSSLHVNAAGGTASYFMAEPDDSDHFMAPVHKAMGRQKMRRYRIPDGYKPHSHWKTFGEFLQDGLATRAQGIGSSDYQGFMRQHKACFRGVEERLKAISADNPRYATSIGKAIQGLSETVGADGGFAVLPEFAPNIFDRVYSNDLFSRTDNYTVVGNRMAFPRNSETSRATGSRSGGLQAYWEGEGDTGTSSKPTLALTELKLKKLMVIVYLTNELIEDNSYALEQWVTRKVAEEFNFMVGNAVINGNGGGQPEGIANSGALVTVAKESGQAADTVVSENIVKMWERRLSTSSLDSLVWLINQSVEPQLQLMGISVGTGGAVSYMPPGGLSEKPYATLMGRPVLPVEFCSAVGDLGDIYLWNPNEYVTISKGGITEAQSAHVEFLTDQLALRFTMRVDGRTYDDSAITPFAAGATTPPTQSSCVTLAARA